MAPAAKAKPHGSSGSDSVMMPAPQLRISFAQQGYRNGQPFRRILKPDADGEWQTAFHTSGTEANSDREAFREVVDRDCDDEQPDPP